MRWLMFGGHVLQGSVRVSFEDQAPRELTQDDLLAVERGVMRDLLAVEQSAILLTQGWTQC